MYLRNCFIQNCFKRFVVNYSSSTNSECGSTGAQTSVCGTTGTQAKSSVCETSSTKSSQSSLCGASSSTGSSVCGASKAAATSSCGSSATQTATNLCGGNRGGNSQSSQSSGKVDKNPPIKVTQIFINNEFIKPTTEKKFPVFNPTTEELIICVDQATPEDVNKAVAAARQAFMPCSPWRRMDASVRGQFIYRLACLMQRDMAYLASLETLNNGKPFKMAYHFDVPAAINTLKYYAGYADKIHGKTIPADGEYFVHTRHEPVGVCGQIIPWNFPLMLLSWKLGPALAAGNTVIIKPSELTPLTTMYIASLVCEAGIPPGVVNILPGFGDVGAAMVAHPEIDLISFSGSVENGKKVQEEAAKCNLKRTVLELGGKSPVIVMDDVDVCEAVDIAHMALFTNMGECCCAGARTLVHEKIYEEFVKLSCEKANKRVVGDPFDEKTQQGPQISEPHLCKILQYVEEGKKEGAKLVTGGKRIDGKGFFMEPTVFCDVQDQMKIAKEEIFGPVQVIQKFSKLDEAIHRANCTPYGLAAGLITKNIDTVNTVVPLLKAGTVWVNDYNVFNPQSTFGGYKMSGHGKELGEYGIKEYISVKCVCTKVPQK